MMTNLCSTLQALNSSIVTESESESDQDFKFKFKRFSPILHDITIFDESCSSDGLSSTDLMFIPKSRDRFRSSSCDSRRHPGKPEYIHCRCCGKLKKPKVSFSDDVGDEEDSEIDWNSQTTSEVSAPGYFRQRSESCGPPRGNVEVRIVNPEGNTLETENIPIQPLQRQDDVDHGQARGRHKERLVSRPPTGPHVTSRPPRPQNRPLVRTSSRRSSVRRDHGGHCDSQQSSPLATRQDELDADHYITLSTSESRNRNPIVQSVNGGMNSFCESSDLSSDMSTDIPIELIPSYIPDGIPRTFRSRSLDRNPRTIAHGTHTQEAWCMPGYVAPPPYRSRYGGQNARENTCHQSVSPDNIGQTAYDWSSNDEDCRNQCNQQLQNYHEKSRHHSLSPNNIRSTAYDWSSNDEDCRGQGNQRFHEEVNSAAGNNARNINVPVPSCMESDNYVADRSSKSLTHGWAQSDRAHKPPIPTQSGHRVNSEESSKRTAARSPSNLPPRYPQKTQSAQDTRHFNFDVQVHPQHQPQNDIHDIPPARPPKPFILQNKVNDRPLQQVQVQDRCQKINDRTVHQVQEQAFKTDRSQTAPPLPPRGRPPKHPTDRPPDRPPKSWLHKKSTSVLTKDITRPPLPVGRQNSLQVPTTSYGGQRSNPASPIVDSSLSEQSHLASTNFESSQIERSHPASTNFDGNRIERTQPVNNYNNRLRSASMSRVNASHQKTHSVSPNFNTGHISRPNLSSSSFNGSYPCSTPASQNFDQCQKALPVAQNFNVGDRLVPVSSNFNGSHQKSLPVAQNFNGCDSSLPVSKHFNGSHQKSVPVNDNPPPLPPRARRSQSLDTALGRREVTSRSVNPGHEMTSRSVDPRRTASEGDNPKCFVEVLV